MRAFAILFAGLVLLSALFWYALLLGPSTRSEELVLKPVAWNALAGWDRDDQGAALSAFQRSCRQIIQTAPEEALGGDGLYGKATDWQMVCAQALTLRASDARRWFEQAFSAFAVVRAGKGLFTGYYEPELEGSLSKSDVFATPLLRRPDDLVSVDLGAFRESLKGQRIAGRVVEGRLEPYETRAEIVGGALNADVLALVWVKDPIEAFFLQIQGSGRVRLADGSIVRVGYDGQNGHPYTAIGRVLRQMGALEPKAISMRTIKDWLETHQGDADMVMDQNASYVFFRLLDVADPALGPEGAERINLTPGRSLAVDRKFHALGVPMWLDTTLPLDEVGTAGEAFRRLMIAQDTGGAITGTARGDVFFGSGSEAEMVAGRMKQPGKLYVFLPKALAAKIQ